MTALVPKLVKITARWPFIATKPKENDWRGASKSACKIVSKFMDPRGRFGMKMVSCQQQQKNPHGADVTDLKNIPAVSIPARVYIHTSTVAKSNDYRLLITIVLFSLSFLEYNLT